jgi:hypothetical protein
LPWWDLRLLPFSREEKSIALDDGAIWVEELIVSAEEAFAHECRIRDLYAARLAEFRPQERLLKTENTFAGSRLRADMRTVDSRNVLRIWEFKIVASYEGLGQVLTYLALERLATNFQREVQGVLAAFSIQTEVRAAVDVLNLGIELVELPAKLRLAGGIPVVAAPTSVADIPNLAQLPPAPEGTPK